MKPKRTKPRLPGIPAQDLLRAEAGRLKVLSHAVSVEGAAMLTAQAWGFEMSAAFLDSLGAPEKLVRYVRAKSKEEEIEREIELQGLKTELERLRKKVKK